MHHVPRLRRPRLFFLGHALAMAALFAVLMLVALPPTTSLTAGPTTQICVALDGSGSIAADDFAIMKNGLASAVEDSSVMPTNGAVEITVIQFGGSPAYIVSTIAEPTVMDSAAAASGVANAVRAAAQLGGYTPTHLAIDTCKEKITGSGNFTGAIKQVINVSTDGNPSDQDLAIAARNNAVAGNVVDEIDLEAIGDSELQISIDNMLAIAYPQPAYVAPPFNGGGFVIRVATFDDYATAIRQKFGEIVPRPTATPTATATATATAGPSPTATTGPSPTPTSSPTATATTVPSTPTPFIKNGGFEGTEDWTMSGTQRTGNRPYAGNWGVDSTPGQNGRLYQIIAVPADTVGIMLYFNWANTSPDTATNGCYDYLQVRIMDATLTQLHGESSAFCSSTEAWYRKGLDFRHLIKDIKGTNIAIVFEVQQDSQAPNAIFFLDEVILYMFDNITYVPIGFRDGIVTSDSVADSGAPGSAPPTGAQRQHGQMDANMIEVLPAGHR